MHNNEMMLSGLRGYIVFFFSLEKNWKKNQKRCKKCKNGQNVLIQSIKKLSNLNKELKPELQL
jgi:hypothetical protein